MCTGRLRREEVEGVNDDADVRDVLEAVREAVGVEMTDSGQSFHPGMEAGAFWKDCNLSDIALVPFSYGSMQCGTLYSQRTRK